MRNLQRYIVENYAGTFVCDMCFINGVKRCAASLPKYIEDFTQIYTVRFGFTKDEMHIHRKRVKEKEECSATLEVNHYINARTLAFCGDYYICIDVDKILRVYTHEDWPY